jgi:type IV secretion system protein VirB3
MSGTETRTTETERGGARVLPIHVALTRPILLAGADRELTLVNVIVCFALLFGIGFSKWTLSIVVFLVTVGQWALGRVTKYDPVFRRVYTRQVQLQAYYPAAPSIHARRSIIHPSVPYSG